MKPTLLVLLVGLALVSDCATQGRGIGPEGGPVFRVGAVEGVVVDSDGDPVPGMSVALLRPWSRGHSLELGSAYQASTDERGRFRLSGVAPGSYYVVAWDSHHFGMIIEWASPRLPEILGASARRVHVPTYYPNAVNLRDAHPILVDAMPIEGLTLTMQRAETYRLRARVEGAPAGSNPRIYIDRADARLFGVRDEQERVPPGRYFVRAEAGPYTKPTAQGAVTVDVIDRDVDVVVPLKPYVRLAGKLTTNGNPLPRQAIVRLVPEDPAFAGIDVSTVPVQSDGTFLIENAPQTAYYVTVPPVDLSLAIRAVRYAGKIFTRPLIDLTEDAPGILEIEVAGPTGSLHTRIPGNTVPKVVSIWETEGDPDIFRDDAVVLPYVKEIDSIHDLAIGDYLAVVWESPPPGGLSYDRKFLSHFAQVAGKARVQPNVYSDIYPARISHETMLKVLEEFR